MSLKKNKLLDLTNIEAFPNVNYLKLSRNVLESPSELKKLGKLKVLKGVSLYDNPLADDKRLYSKMVMEICPNLESLDHKSCSEVKKKYEIEDQEINAKHMDNNKLTYKLMQGSDISQKETSPKGLKVISIPTEHQPQQEASHLKNQTVILSKAFSNPRRKNNSTDKPISAERKGGEAAVRDTGKDVDEKDDENMEDEEDIDKDEGKGEENADGIASMNPKSMSAVKLSFEKILSEKTSILQTNLKIEQEVWLGNSPTHPIGFFKKVGTNGYRVVGDGIWMMMASKVVALKSIEEVACL